MCLVFLSELRLFVEMMSFLSNVRYTGFTQKNDAVSKVKKKFISHLTQAQRTPSAAATVQVSHVLISPSMCAPWVTQHTSTR
jgi:hypothetical protein